MPFRSQLRRTVRPFLKSRLPGVWRRLIGLDTAFERTRHAVASRLPVLIRPDPRHLEVAITAHCNLRCLGCRYGRTFMPGAQLPLPLVRTLLDDAAALGMWDVRFYGGEPLLHPDLPRMIDFAVSRGLNPYVTTNGTRLKDTIDDLYAAGLRQLNIGFYGTAGHYDSYVQRPGRFQLLEAGVSAVRERYGSEIQVRINWLLSRRTCSIEALHAAVEFAERYDTEIQVDLIHYSLPYFTEGPDRALQFRPDDRPAILRVTAELLRLREEDPGRFNQDALTLRSIPEWLLKGRAMRVPCDSHQMLWVGADGTVQQCYVTFRLGNLYDQSLREMVGTPAHRAHSRNSHALNCPNCHCHYGARVQKHAPTLRRLSRSTLEAPPDAAAAAGVPVVPGARVGAAVALSPGGGDATGRARIPGSA